MSLSRRGAGRGARACSRGGRRAQWPGERTDRGRPRGAAASESRALAAASAIALALADRVARGDRERARGARRTTARPKRRAAPARGAAAPAAGAALGCQGEGFQARRGGCRLHSPSSSSLRPSPRSSHIMAPLSRPRASSAGAAARLSLAEMMGVRGARVAPRGLGVPRRPGLHARPARTTRRKPVPQICPCHQLRRGRLPHLARRD